MAEDYKALYETLLKDYNILKENEAVLEENGMKLSWRDPKQLKQREKNSKKHGQQDLKGLYASVKEFGFKDILLIEPDDTIIAGHGRDLIAIELAKERVPVIICTDLDKAKARAYSIAHNVTSRNSKFNDDNITFEFGELKAEGYDLEPLAPMKIDKWTEDLNIPEFNIDEYKPPEPEDLTVADVPDVIWPSDNIWEIPTLALNMQATSVDLPIVQWGDISRKTKIRGTWHFWAEDLKFEALWKDPTGPLYSRAQNCVEPNFSNYDQMSRAYVMGRIYEKRWIACYWQSKGMKIFVDLNVNHRFYDLNMLGIPPGWLAWSTRGYAKREDKVLEQYEMAVERAGTDKILFWVYSGGETIKKLCQDHNWLYVEDRRKFDRATWTAQFNKENEGA